jgi:hypothetical protein
MLWLPKHLDRKELVTSWWANFVLLLTNWIWDDEKVKLNDNLCVLCVEFLIKKKIIIKICVLPWHFLISLNNKFQPFFFVLLVYSFFRFKGDGDDDGEDSGDRDEASPSCMDYIMHFLTLFWKILFAFIPPTGKSDFLFVIIRFYHLLFKINLGCV